MAARLLGLDVEQTEAALGIAASLAAGLRVNFGTSTKALHAGAAARHGIQAAQLAQAGATANPAWLLGPDGMLAVFGGDVDEAGGHAALAAARSGPHGIESGWGLVQKPYSCCGSCHAALDAAIAAAEAADCGADAIERIEIHVDPLIPQIMRRGLPVSPYEARYSVSWAVAAAVLDGVAGPAQFSAEALARADIHRLRERVQVIPDLQTGTHDRFAGRAVLIAGGVRYEHSVRHAAGHPLNPMSTDRQEHKQLVALSLVMDEVPARELVARIAGLAALPGLDGLAERIRAAVGVSGCEAMSTP